MPRFTRLIATVAAPILLAASILPAYAETAAAIVAPAGDTGFWSAINGEVGPLAATAVGAAVTWASVQIARLTGAKLTSELEERVRQTALTGVYQAIHDLELKLDQTWTPAQRQQVITQAVRWVMQRLGSSGGPLSWLIGGSGILARLGFDGPVVQAIVVKMLGSVLVQNPVFDLGEPTTFSGNPGETPALDRAAGPPSGAERQSAAAGPPSGAERQSAAAGPALGGN